MLSCSYISYLNLKLPKDKVWKNGKRSWVFVFFKATTSALEVKCFPCWSNLIQSHPCVCSTPCEKLCSCTFYISIDHLFNNFESEKRNYCFGVKSGKSLEYWIQQSVQTLCKPAQGNLDVMKGQVSGKILSL